MSTYGTGTSINEKKRQKYLHEKNEKNNLGDKVFLSKRLAQERPYYMCVVCNRCPYRRSMILYPEGKFPLLDENSLDLLKSYDGNFYIYKTCSRKIKKGYTSCKLFVINWRFMSSLRISRCQGIRKSAYSKTDTF